MAVMALMAVALTSCTLDSLRGPRRLLHRGAGDPPQQDQSRRLPAVGSELPPLVALKIKAKLPVFRDVSCSGATTDDMTAPQDVTPGPANPPQFDALDSNTKAVSLTIGGNDIGFVSIAEDCFSRPRPQGNSGTPCQDKYVVNGNDEVSQRIAEAAPKVAEVFARHPHAVARGEDLPARLPRHPPRHRTGLLSPDAGHRW